MSDGYTLVQDWTPCPQIETVDRHARRVFHAKRCADIMIETMRAMMHIDPLKWGALADLGEALVRGEVEVFQETNRRLATIPRPIRINPDAPKARLVLRIHP